MSHEALPGTEPVGLDADAPEVPAARPGRSGWNPWLNLAAGGIALAVIGWAGVSAYQAWREERDHFGWGREIVDESKPILDPGAPSAGVPVAAERLEIETPLSIARGPDGVAVVALGAAKGPGSAFFLRPSVQGILARELLRQSILIAARDELGLPTRDAVLGETRPANASTSATMTTLCLVDKPGRIAIRAGGKELLASPLPGFEPTGRGYREALIAAEALGREQVPAALKGLGADGKATVAVADAPVPAEVEALMGRFDELSQFAAVRALHDLIRKEGESPARLGALARAYATLGLLAEFQVAPAHKVYKARGLLYAQRLVARSGGAGRSLALRHRAYAEAMAGLFADAIDDLDVAAKVAAPGEAPPPWSDLISAYVHQNIPAIKAGDAADRQVRGLAAILAMQAQELPENRRRFLDAIGEALKVAPGCSLAYHQAWRTGSVGLLHVTTTVPIDRFNKEGLGVIKSIGGLDERVRQRVEPGATIDALAREMGRAEAGEADRGEPSCQALGALIRETRFVQAQHRLTFLSQNLSVSPAGEMEALRPLFEGHRLAAALGAQPGEIPASAYDDLDMTARGLLTGGNLLFERLPTDVAAGLEARIDAVRHDVAVVATQRSSVTGSVSPSLLLEVSPDDRYGVALALAAGDRALIARQGDLLKRMGDDPLIVEAIGRNAFKQGRYAEAIPALERSVELSPEPDSLLKLAISYQKIKKFDEFVAAMERILALPDAGLAHAQTRVLLAEHFMDQKQYERARPYAEAAAASYAEWAIDCLVECYEGLGLLDQAEEWRLRAGLRYPSVARNWFSTAMQMGYATRDRGRRLYPLMRWPGEVAETPHMQHIQMLALLDEFDQVIKGCRRMLKDDDNPTGFASTLLILACDRTGDRAGRDQQLARFRAAVKGSPHEPLYAAIADALGGPDPIALEASAVEALLKAIPEAERETPTALAALLLAGHGRGKEARPLLHRIAEDPRGDGLHRCLATRRLLELGETIDPKVRRVRRTQARDDPN